MEEKDNSSFDIAAKKADEELLEMASKWTPDQKKVVNEVASWWKRNFMQAGHKRLGRIIARLG